MTWWQNLLISFETDSNPPNTIDGNFEINFFHGFHLLIIGVMLYAVEWPPSARFQRASPSLQRRGIKGVVVIFWYKKFNCGLNIKILNIIVLNVKLISYLFITKRFYNTRQTLKMNLFFRFFIKSILTIIINKNRQVRINPDKWNQKLL